MDFRLFRFLNGSLRGHEGIAQAVLDFSNWSVPLFAAAAIGLWLLARPYGLPRWKLAAVSALSSAGFGLLVNQAIGRSWFRARPFTAHPAATLLLGQRSRDPSFPSDHATAAFAVAFAVLAFSIRVGLGFFAAASLIGVSRVLVGLHYPGDVLAGAVIGLACALLVTTVGRRWVELVVRLASRISDPTLASVERRLRRVRR